MEFLLFNQSLEKLSDMNTQCDSDAQPAALVEAFTASCRLIVYGLAICSAMDVLSDRLFVEML